MSFLAITSYFNPFHGKLRQKNYRTFRKHLGVKLLTVEWSREGDFDLCEQDADYLIQVSGGDPLWQKERLLNIGLAKARELGFSRLAFLDCDIVFTDPDWFRSVNSELEICPIIQCFTHVNYLPPVDYSRMSRKKLTSLQPYLTRLSLAYELLQFDRVLVENPETPISNRAFSALDGNPGMAVAIRIDDQYQWKIYEGNIVGGGDTVLMAAATDHLDELFSVRLYSPAHQKDIRIWRDASIPSNVQLGYAKNEIAHLWHGELENRKYLERHAILLECDYDPASDLDVTQHGALAFTNGESKIKRAVAEYLVSRQDF